MVVGVCPECDAEVSFPAQPSLRERVYCPRCKVALLVIGLEPVRLDWAFVEPLSDPNQESRRIRFEPNWHKEV